MVYVVMLLGEWLTKEDELGVMSVGGLLVGELVVKR